MILNNNFILILVNNSLNEYSIFTSIFLILNIVMDIVNFIIIYNHIIKKIENSNKGLKIMLKSLFFKKIN